MSLDAVQMVIGKATTDPEFRQKLLTNAEEALQGMDLTPEEIDALKNLKSEELEAFSKSLDERITKGFFTIGS